ncbi:hypothetical protein OS493_022343 [Desmophyllum pertusum]|uniref:Uncharacterized protein n=1 Tax=Desmophyllum pertusum TaxID=174260 RepID=A0A9X0A0C1_9CNID|nr:hypothetical protein OS493_022343 [Desmophyllum pertusum]
MAYIYYLSNPPKDFFLPLYRRRKILEDGSYGDPETILDQNELKERYSHVDIQGLKCLPRKSTLLSCWTKSGEGTHSLYITEAHEGMINFVDAIPKVVNFEWGSDDLTMYYNQALIDNPIDQMLSSCTKTCQSVLSDVVLQEEER